MESYKEYLGGIEFQILNDPTQLTMSMLNQLENKNGYVIEGKYDVYVSRKFEPMKFLNQAVVMEHTSTFNVIDMFGLVMYQGSAEEVVDFIGGFFSEEEV